MSDAEAPEWCGECGADLEPDEPECWACGWPIGWAWDDDGEPWPGVEDVTPSPKYL